MIKRSGKDLPADHTHMAWHAAQRLSLEEKAWRLSQNGLTSAEIADRLGVAEGVLLAALAARYARTR